MKSKITFSNKKVGAIAGISLAVLLVILLVLLIQPSSASVPEEFTLARQDAATASKKISRLFNSSIRNISVIARYEREDRNSEALELLNEEIRKSAQRNQAALELASAIDKMAQSTDLVNSRRARDEATKAVSAQVAAITQVLAYNDIFNQLAQEIQDKINSQSNDEAKIDLLLDDLNSLAKRVNELNTEFTTALEKFDGILKIQ